MSEQTIHTHMDAIVSPKIIDSFTAFENLAPPKYRERLDEFLSILLTQCHKWTKPDLQNSPSYITQRHFDRFFPDLSKSDSSILKLSIVAKLAKRTPELIKEQNLPSSIISYYPAAFNRLLSSMEMVAENPDDRTYDMFNKIAFVLGINLPCGSLNVDLYSSIPISSAILSVQRERSVRTLIQYFYTRGHGPWLRTHVEAEYLDEFNEEGWDNYYLRIAQLLIQRKNIRGLVGTSWFYDPQLISVSPRLSYLQKRQLERGAFNMRHSGSDSDVMFATKTSKTRKRLYDEGKYKPVSYSLIWGRKPLLKWANETWSDQS